MNITQRNSLLSHYIARLEQANSIEKYRETLQTIILELVQGYSDKKFTADDVIYILNRLPDEFTKNGEIYSFGIDKLSESVVTGSTHIAFDGGDSLAQKAAEKLQGKPKK
ncbi:hypothetical protein [Serratia proteamaculans]